MAPLKAIVANMTQGAPHKIGTQLLVQAKPQLIAEVAPVQVVTELFGSYFTANAVRGAGPFGMLPALTTVPLFVAGGGGGNDDATSAADAAANESADDTASNDEKVEQPFTALHCEPIGNVAVQLSGMKQWTLIRPEFSHAVKPSISPDGRAFFASWWSSGDDYSHVPSYTAITGAGDALWVPTWTWHRVDYVESQEMAIGASLFHFRLADFCRNNPLFALLIVPAMVGELIGSSTQ